MNKKQRKTWDDFLGGTFTSGGIFDEPAQVKFKEPQKPPPKMPVPKKETHRPTLDPTIAVKIKKLEAVINDTRAPEPERNTARQLKEKILKGANYI